MSVTRKLYPKRKLRYRIIAALLAIMLVLSLPLGINLGLAEVQAAESVDSGKWGDNGVTWEFKNGTLTIHGNGATKIQDCPFTNHGVVSTFHMSWSRYNEQIKRVIIDEGITSIGDWVFYNFYPNLEVVNLPSTLQRIGKYTFAHCPKLQKAILPNNLKEIGDGAFDNCVKLSNPTLPRSITKIGEGAFFNCDRITKIVIPAGLRTINDSFSGCKNLVSAKIMPGATKINQEAFAECYKLKSIDLPASVSSISFRAFDDCKSLTKIIIRNRNCKISLTNVRFNLTIPKKTVIYGYKGSSAEKYAKKAGNKFKTISKTNSSKLIKVKKLKITGAPKKLKAGKAKTLKVKVTPTNATNKKVTWKSSNKKYATVNSKGKVTAKKAGRGKTVKITATAKDGSKKKATVKIKITK